MTLKDYINGMKKHFGFQRHVAIQLCYQTGIIRGIAMLDFPALDEYFGKIVAEYRPDECMYKGKTASMKSFVLQHYGPEAVDFLKATMK